MITLLISATTDVIGNPSNAFLPGTRAAAMGYAYTAVTDDNLSLFWNPAGLVITSRQQISIGLALDHQNSTISFYPQYLIFSSPQQLKGAWAVGGYAIKQETVKYAIGVAHARRLNQFFRFGVSVFHLPDFTRWPRRASQWGLSAGLIFQPNLNWRWGMLLQSTGKPIFSYNNSIKDDPWLQIRLGMAWRFISRGMCALDVNLLNQKVHFGIEIQVLQFGAVRMGVSSQFARHQLQQHLTDNLTLHAGLSFRLPGLDYGKPLPQFIKSMNIK